LTIIDSASFAAVTFSGWSEQFSWFAEMTVIGSFSVAKQTTVTQTNPMSFVSANF